MGLLRTPKQELAWVKRRLVRSQEYGHISYKMQGENVLLIFESIDLCNIMGRYHMEEKRPILTKCIDGVISSSQEIYLRTSHKKHAYSLHFDIKNEYSRRDRIEDVCVSKDEFSGLQKVVSIEMPIYHPVKVQISIRVVKIEEIDVKSIEEAGFIERQVRNVVWEDQIFTPLQEGMHSTMQHYFLNLALEYYGDKELTFSLNEEKQKCIEGDKELYLLLEPYLKDMIEKKEEQKEICYQTQESNKNSSFKIILQREEVTLKEFYTMQKEDVIAYLDVNTHAFSMAFSNGITTYPLNEILYLPFEEEVTKKITVEEIIRTFFPKLKIENNEM